MISLLRCSVGWEEAQSAASETTTTTRVSFGDAPSGIIPLAFSHLPFALVQPMYADMIRYGPREHREN